MTSKGKTYEVEIPPIQIVSEKSTEEQIMELFAKHPQLTVGLVIAVTGGNRNTIENALARMEDRGLLTHKKMRVMKNGRRLPMNVYSLS